jgi:hypothetical protein
MIILIPKEKGARSLKKYRPISLINCSFKIFAKALNNMLEIICDRLLAVNQTAFVKDRYILESVVSAHEIIHDAENIKEKRSSSSWIMRKLMIRFVGSFLKKCYNPKASVLDG